MIARFLRALFHAALAALVLTAALIAWILYPPPARKIAFPDGKTFAFTIVDDTDQATLERNRPVYDVLYRHGLRTTKTVWIMGRKSSTRDIDLGDSLQDPAYREFILDLDRKGFEIAMHGIRGGSSERADIVAGLETFRKYFGEYPLLHVNHALNRDNLYWGSARWSFGPFRWSYGFAKGGAFSGHEPESPHFWGDLAKQHVRYVNQFTYQDINLLNVTPAFPYHLPDKPFVQFWFPTSDGHNLDQFERLLSPENLDRLEREGGVCLVYSHLGAGSFNDAQGANPRFEARIRDLASRNGWFVPASELLDFLATQPGWQAEPGWRERVRLELLFLWEVLTN